MMSKKSKKRSGAKSAKRQHRTRQHCHHDHSTRIHVEMTEVGDAQFALAFESLRDALESNEWIVPAPLASLVAPLAYEAPPEQVYALLLPPLSHAVDSHIAEEVPEPEGFDAARAHFAAVGEALWTIEASRCDWRSVPRLPSPADVFAVSPMLHLLTTINAWIFSAAWHQPSAQAVSKCVADFFSFEQNLHQS